VKSEEKRHTLIVDDYVKILFVAMFCNLRREISTCASRKLKQDEAIVWVPSRFHCGDFLSREGRGQKFGGKLTSSYVKDCDIVLDECEDDKDEQSARVSG
jgi:hypothetical protein